MANFTKIKVFFLIIIVGIIAVMFVVLMNPIRSQSNKWYGALFPSDYLPFLNSQSSEQDDNERLLIYKKLGEAYPFKQSSQYQYEKNYYCLAGGLHSIVTIYEIVDPDEQQKIIQVAKNIKKQFNTRAFVIEFYTKQTGPSPKDQFILKVRID